MVAIQSILEQNGQHLSESMGVRQNDVRPQLSPIASPKDVGRKRHRHVGCVDIDRVVPDHDQPRQKFSEEALKRLSQSIRAKGQMLPIHVRWSEDQEKWIIISGERRWRAAKAAGIETVDCYFHEQILTESEIREQQLVENLLREDLRPMEEARGFSSLMVLNHWNGRQVAAALHVSPSKVSRALALLDLPEEIQQQIEAGELVARSAYEISKLPNTKSQRDLAERTTTDELTHTQTAKAARQRRGKSIKDRGVRLVFTDDSGWKVTVSSKKQGTYHDIEQALEYALDEVCLRIANNVTIL